MLLYSEKSEERGLKMIKQCNYFTKCIYVIGRGENFESKNLLTAMNEFAKRCSTEDCYVGLGITLIGSNANHYVIDVLNKFNKKVEISNALTFYSKDIREIIQPTVEEIKILINKFKNCTVA